MAPTKPQDVSEEHAREHEEFLSTLEAYHAKRGWVSPVSCVCPGRVRLLT